MISRDLVLTITDKSVSLDKTVTLYRYDRGITLNIRLQSDTYDLIEEITKARAIVLRPNKKVSATEIADIVDGVYVLHLDNTWTDHLGEIGAYQVQLQLYSDNPDDECITIAPFTFEVKNPIGIPTDTLAYVNIATVNNYSTGDSTDVPVGDLENGQYLKTSWIGGDVITSGKLNKIETAIDYLVTDSTTYVTEEEMPNFEDYATKEELDNVYEIISQNDVLYDEENEVLTINELKVDYDANNENLIL